MNPMDWLKAIYDFFGTPYPRVSLVVVTILGGAAAASIWSFAAKQVEKDRNASTVPSQVSGPASTAGDNSPANTGSENEFKYDQSPPDAKGKPKPSKRKSTP